MKTYFIVAAAALLFVLAGCGGETADSVRFFYSNGRVVADSVHLRLLERELPEILQQYGIEEKNICVYTSLRAGVNQDLRSRLIPVENEICENSNLKNTSKPNLRKEVSQFRKEGKFFDAAVVAIDNQTGQICAYFSTYSDKKSDGVSTLSPIGSLSQTFSFAQGLWREYTPFDVYPRYDQYHNRPDADFNRPFYQALEMASPTYAQGLDRRYTKQESEEFLQLFEVAHSSLNDPVFRFKTKMSLLDVTKAYSAFYNEGELHRPSLVDKITDSKGRLLYKYKLDSRQTIGKETANEIMQILTFHYAYEPREDLYKEKHTPEFIGQFKPIEARANGNGWFIAITDDYTIGIRNFISHPGVSYPKKSRHIQLRDRTFPLWLMTLQKLRKDKSATTLRKFDVSGMKRQVYVF